MNILTMRRGLFLPFFFLVLLSTSSCSTLSHKNELVKKNEEVKTMRLDLQLKEKAMSDILNRLSWKDQEIGKLTDELRSSKITIESLRDDIEKLRKTDLLERLSTKDQEIGRLTDELHNARTSIEGLKNNMEKFQKTEFLDQLSMKEREIGKLTNELHSTQSTIKDLTTDIGKLREVDIQMEEKKKEVGNQSKERMPLVPLDTAPGVDAELMK